MFSPSRRIIQRVLKPVVFVLALLPFLNLVYLAIDNGLGANPVETVTHQTGLWGLYLLLITLSVTPARKLTGMNWLIQFRRLLGLMAFFYATMHLTVYLWLDQFFNWQAIVEDIVKRPYITVGFTAWLLLLPLALTSNSYSIRKLAKRWGQLHQLVYPVVFLVLLHFIWLVKADYLEPVTYLLLFVVLLMMRTAFFQKIMESLQR